MSTPLGQPNSAYSWKQEVSRRVVAHRSRGGSSTGEPATSVQSLQEPGSRAAQIAARVAARYAQAPSYSQMRAEACTTQQAVPETFPEHLTASIGPRLWETEAEQIVTSVQPSTEDWEPDFALRPPEPVHGVLFTQANIIEFPRELVAPRKRRPRRAERSFAAEGPLASDGLELQLNIFEMDLGALSMQPGTAGVAPAWTSPEWSSIKLEAQPSDDPEPEPQSAPAPQPGLRQASLRLRMMAALVDGALIACTFFGSALAAMASIGAPLPAGIAKISALSGILLAGLLYQTLFLILDDATPGMRCAGVYLITFDDQCPTRAQLRRRLGAQFLSILPVGLGVAWLLFDDDHLCWHDRLSRTYLRKG